MSLEDIGKDMTRNAKSIGDAISNLEAIMSKFNGSDPPQPQPPPLSDGEFFSPSSREIKGLNQTRFGHINGNDKNKNESNVLSQRVLDLLFSTFDRSDNSKYSNKYDKIITVFVKCNNPNCKRKHSKTDVFKTLDLYKAYVDNRGGGKLKRIMKRI